MKTEFQWQGGNLRSTMLGSAWETEPFGVSIRIPLENDYSFSFGKHSVGALLKKYQHEPLVVQIGAAWLMNTKSVLNALPAPRPNWFIEAVVPVSVGLIEEQCYSNNEDWHYEIGARLGVSAGDFPLDRGTFDAFMIHAHEDKKDFVRPLVYSLRVRGFKIWFDEFNIKVGDSIRKAIDVGLARSRFGIVILSPSFLEKKWPQYELDGLITKEVVDQKVLLPVWYDIDFARIRDYSLTLADRAAVIGRASDVESVAVTLAQVLGSGR